MHRDRLTHAHARNTQTHTTTGTHVCRTHSLASGELAVSIIYLVWPFCFLRSCVLVCVLDLGFWFAYALRAVLAHITAANTANDNKQQQQQAQTASHSPLTLVVFVLI